jgi:transcriptional regulator with XRE-family HTH domain
MPTKVPCYLRTLRKQWELTQQELALLVGRGDRNRVSLLENGKVPPSSSELFSYALIFGVPPQDIFPRFADQVQDAVLLSAAELDKRLGNSPAGSVSLERKIELLRQLVVRASSEESSYLDV